MKQSLLTGAFALCLTFGVAAGAHAQVVVHVGPPAPIHEAVPPPPHEGWVWQPGYHRWDGSHYVWVGGTYAEPPHHGARWVPGHWANRGGGWVWIDGHWR